MKISSNWYSFIDLSILYKSRKYIFNEFNIEMILEAFEYENINCAISMHFKSCIEKRLKFTTKEKEIEDVNSH